MKAEEVWKYFHREENNKAKCAFCAAVFTLKNNVLSMLRHLKMFHGLKDQKEVSEQQIVVRNILLENVLDFSLSKNNSQTEDLFNPFFIKILKMISPTINFQEFSQVIMKKEETVRNWIIEWRNLLNASFYSFILMEEEEATTRKKLTMFVTDKDLEIKRVTLYIGKHPSEFICVLNNRYGLFSKTIFIICSHKQLYEYFENLPDKDLPKIASPDDLLLKSGKAIIDSKDFQKTFRGLSNEEQKFVNHILEKFELSIKLVRVRCFLSDVVPTVTDLVLFINSYNGPLGEFIISNLVTNVHCYYFNSRFTKNILNEASVLDPRYKLKYLNEQEKDIAYNTIKHRIYALESIDTPNDIIKRKVQKVLLAYLNEPLLDRSEDPIKWWEENREKYGLLYSLAKIFFCIRLDDKCKFPTDVINDNWDMEKSLDIDKMVYLFNRLDGD